MHKSVIGLIGIGVVIILMSVIMGGLKSSATNSRWIHSVSLRRRADNRYCRHTGIAVEGIDFICADDHIQLCVRLPVMRAGFRK